MSSSPKFKPGERVAYVSGDSAILGRVEDILLLGDVWHLPHRLGGFFARQGDATRTQLPKGDPKWALI